MFQDLWILSRCITTKKFVKSSIWSDSLKVGCVPQRDRHPVPTDKIMSYYQIISYYQRKRDRSGKLHQSGLKVIHRLGNFHTYIREKDVRTSQFVLILSSENWMCFTDSLKYFNLDCVFISKT